MQTEEIKVGMILRARGNYTFDYINKKHPYSLIKVVDIQGYDLFSCVVLISREYETLYKKEWHYKSFSLSPIDAEDKVLLAKIISKNKRKKKK